MKAVIQLVSRASVAVDNQVIGEVSHGLMVLLGVAEGDSKKQAEQMADKIVMLRIFPDEHEKMNLSVQDVNGSMLVVSQFTLLADTKKGNRPSYIKAAPPELAKEIYDYFVEYIRGKGINVQTGRFQAMMEVSLVNSGPTTIILEN